LQKSSPQTPTKTSKLSSSNNNNNINAAATNDDDDDAESTNAFIYALAQGVDSGALK
jgi:hypothetical protein